MDDVVSVVVPLVILVFACVGFCYCCRRCCCGQGQGGRVIAPPVVVSSQPTSAPYPQQQYVAATVTNVTMQSVGHINPMCQPGVGYPATPYPAAAPYPAAPAPAPYPHVAPHSNTLPPSYEQVVGPSAPAHDKQPPYNPYLPQ